MATYNVQSGDDLSKIAAKNGMTVQQLIALNPQFANPNLIQPGQTVNLGGSSNLNFSAIPGGQGLPNLALNVAHTTPQTNLTPAKISTPAGGGGGGSYGGTPAKPAPSSQTTQNKNTTGGGSSNSSYKSSASGGANGGGSSNSNSAANNLGMMQRALLGAVADVSTSASLTGKPPVSFAEALDLATRDPVIVAKYSDALKLDTQSFQQAIQQLSTAYSVDSQNRQMQFENDRKQLAEQSAAAGQAYSGFRGKAQQQLGQTQAGIVTSSRSQLQKSLNDATSAFEARYGTGRTSPATVAFTDPLASSTVSLSGQSRAQSPVTNVQAGQLAGGITGTEAPQKADEIRSSALNSYNTALFPSI